MHPNPTSHATMKTSFFVVLVLSLISSSVHAQGTKQEPFPLVERVTQACAEILMSHIIEGNCCSFQDTDEGGCELSVINGRCKVRTFLKNFMEGRTLFRFQNWEFSTVFLLSTFIFTWFFRLMETFGIWTFDLPTLLTNALRAHIRLRAVRRLDPPKHLPPCQCPLRNRSRLPVHCWSVRV